MFGWMDWYLMWDVWINSRLYYSEFFVWTNSCSYHLFMVFQLKLCQNITSLCSRRSDVINMRAATMWQRVEWYNHVDVSCQETWLADAGWWTTQWNKQKKRKTKTMSSVKMYEICQFTVEQNGQIGEGMDGRSPVCCLGKIS